MKKNMLLRTNILVCTIITIGFIVTSMISYHSNTSIFKKDVEHVTMLTSEGIYYKLDKILSEPVNVSLTMANDSLLKSFLAIEALHLNDASYTQKMQEYLSAYRDKYSYDSVFLVSTSTNRYYHFDGIDRVLTPDSDENAWYYKFLKDSDEYALNVDNDEATDNSITSFVNCKIKDKNGRTIGVIGVGLRVSSLQTLLKEYNEKFGVSAWLVDANGTVQISSEETGYNSVNLFDILDLRDSMDSNPQISQDLQAFWNITSDMKSHMVARYVPILKWNLVVQNDMTATSNQLRTQLYSAIGIIILIIILVLFIITRVLKQYKAQIIILGTSQKLDYHNLLDQTTAELYDNIFEIDITHNSVDEKMAQYLADLGLPIATPYDQGLREIARSQIKKEYMQGYLDCFLPEHVLESYNRGIHNLSYDLMIVGAQGDYHWARISTRIFYWESDDAVHMISYRKNVDAEKKRELLLIEKSQRDSMTGLYNKGVMEQSIANILEAEAGTSNRHVMLIFDIDDFKHVNDKYGHAFGDIVITEFAAEIKSQFRDSDIVGRVGGDEFCVLMADCVDAFVLSEKLERFCCRISKKDFGQPKDEFFTCSIGGALYPDHGRTYAELYEKADQALYFAKAHGKGIFEIIGSDSVSDVGIVSHMDARDIRNLLETATDGVAKYACTSPMKILYFNQHLLDLTGSEAKTYTMPDFNVLSYIHPSDLPAALKALHAAIPDKTPVVLALRIRHRTGHYIPIKIHILIVNELYQNRYPIFYAVCTDLSGPMPPLE